MKIEISLRPAILAGILFILGMIILILGIHLDSAISSTREAIFFFGLMIPVLAPPSLFEESKADIFILTFGFFGALLLCMWANPSNYYVLNLTHNKIIDVALQIMLGIVGLQVINIIAWGSQAKKISPNNITEEHPELELS